MAVMRDELVMEEVSEMILKELTETISYCDECETQVHDFIKIANCILNREEFYDLLNRYKKFESNFGILESLSAQVEHPLSILQAVTLKATMKELKKDFDQLVEMMEMSNERIDANEIDFPMARLLQRLVKIMEFDAIHYEDLQEAMKKTFIILKISDMFDEMYQDAYYPLSVLRITSFKDKIGAYEYALKHGIRRDFILNRHGAQLT